MKKKQLPVARRRSPESIIKQKATLAAKAQQAKHSVIDLDAIPDLRPQKRTYAPRASISMQDKIALAREIVALIKEVVK